MKSFQIVFEPRSNTQTCTRSDSKPFLSLERSYTVQYSTYMPSRVPSSFDSPNASNFRHISGLIDTNSFHPNQLHYTILYLHVCTAVPSSFDCVTDLRLLQKVLTGEWNKVASVAWSNVTSWIKSSSSQCHAGTTGNS